MFLSLGLTISCASKKNIVAPKEPCDDLKEIVIKDTVYIEKEIEILPKINVLDDEFSNKILDDIIENSPLLSKGLSGLVIYDLGQKKYFYSKNGHKYFTPASNTKIFTLNASLRMLGDSIPALRYVETDNTLIIWPTGDPTLLNAKMPESQVINFLKARVHKKIIISDAHVDLNHFGKGWMWDDYNDDYHAELSAFPIYGNVVTFTKDKYNLLNQPHLEEWKFFYDENARFVSRQYDQNLFSIPYSKNVKAGFKQEVPYKNAKDINKLLLEKNLGTKLYLEKIPLPKDAMKLYSIPVDTVLRFMMQESDNFLAEQLVLLVGMESMDILNTKAALQFSQDNLLKILTHKPIWVDGSGLSRYNKMTPQSYCELLIDMYSYTEEPKLFSYMSVGGVNGTLKNLYKNGNKPYIFAKSGTLTGVYNISGYLITKSGKKLVFSFMNNNFTDQASQVRKEVERIIKNIYENN